MAKLIEIDLSKPILDFVGEALFTDKPEATLSYALSKFILQGESKSENLAKLMLWVGDLRESAKLSLDAEDFKTLLEIVKHSQVGAVIKGPIYVAMQAAKEASEKAE